MQPRQPTQKILTGRLNVFNRLALPIAQGAIVSRSDRRPSFVAEPLESRTLLNGADGPIVITGTDGPDTIELYYGQLADWNWTWNYSVNGVGKGLYDFDASNIVINGKGGNDKITVFSLP